VSAPVRTSNDERNDPAQLWTAAAAAVPRATRRRLFGQLMLGVVAVPGLFELFLVGRWATSWAGGSWMIGLLLGVHLAAIAIALGPTIRPFAADDDSLVARLTARYVDRLQRLRALRRALLIEVLVLWLQPVVLSVVAGAQLRWGVWFTIAVATVWIVVPLERIALAQRNEGGRLGVRDLR
jgi:hypothetical protein